jgi:hypothetical protein
MWVMASVSRSLEDEDEDRADFVGSLACCRRDATFRRNIAAASYGQIKKVDVFVWTSSTLTDRESKDACAFLISPDAASEG